MTTKELINALVSDIDDNKSTIGVSSVLKYRAETPDLVGDNAFPYIGIDFDDQFIADEDIADSTQKRTHRIRYGLWQSMSDNEKCFDSGLDITANFIEYIKTQRIGNINTKRAQTVETYKGVDESEERFLIGVIVVVEYEEEIDIMGEY